MVRKFLIQAACICLTVTAGTKAADSSSGLGDMIASVGQSAAVGYLSPFVTVLGTGMNSGWYNSAKPFSMFGLPIGFNIGMVTEPFVVIDKSMRTFNFQGNLPMKKMLNNAFQAQGSTKTFDSLNNSIALLAALPVAQRTQIAAEAGVSTNVFNADSLGMESEIPFIAADQPTIFGADSNAGTTMSALLAGSKSLKTIKVMNAMTKITKTALGQPVTASDTIDISGAVPLPFVGLGKAVPDIMPSIPGLTAQVGISKIPVIDNFTVGVRFFPEMEIPTFGKVGQLGFMASYEWLHFVPLIKILPLSSTVSYAMNNMWIHTPQATIDQSNWIATLAASADLKALVFGAGLYAGVSVESSNLALGVNMADIDPNLPEFKVNIPGKNNFRFTIGPRFTLACVELWGDASFGTVNSYSVGVSLLSFTGKGL